jgi:hypothetical protein
MTEKDVSQIISQGRSPEQAEIQLGFFRTGFPFLPIDRAAVVGDGIERLSPEALVQLAAAWEQQVGGLSAVKFVPASGAASRMFKEMYEFVQQGKESASVREALSDLEKFAFHDALMEALPDGVDDRTVIENIVEGALGYGKLPKALILFHRYPYPDGGPRTALEEHLVEGALYARSGDGVSGIHFTISPEHEKAVRALVDRVLPEYEKRYGVTYDISYSQQKAKTDTIAVDADNRPFREPDGTILFRPGGHGALLENLNELDAELIFIKTVDNVCPDRMKGDTVAYKKALAGLLLDRQEQCFAFLRKLDGDADEKMLDQIAFYAQTHLSWKPAPDFPGKSTEEQKEILRELLDRPIRVCGMVKNEGEPGGGPFWVKNADGSQSLQIAESSQIAPEQKHLMREATHFNPVDLVCGVYDHTGKKYDLTRFVDPQTGFISVKSKDGRELKAQELPGLWNGAMARWNTVFVEVPITTFSPVKTVNDLLRPQHQ